MGSANCNEESKVTPKSTFAAIEEEKKQAAAFFNPKITVS